jgi:predicted glycosyltransferase
MFFYARKFNPDLVLSYSSYHASVTGWLLRKLVLTFEDTENVPLLHYINWYFSSKMITPACYKGDFGKKHIRFNGYKELASLYPDLIILNTKSPKDKPSFLLRFVSWKAWHDRGHSGISDKMKEKIIMELAALGKVYISSEDEIPEKWRKFQLDIKPEFIYDFFLGNIDLFFGESASMSSEAAVLGIPAIYIDNVGRGYTHELEDRYELLFRFGESDEEVQQALEKATELCLNQGTYKEWQEKRIKLLHDKVNVCEWMINFIEETYNAHTSK